MKTIGMFVGNGFTLDFITKFRYNSSFPLRNFKSDDVQYNAEFMTHLPAIKEHLLDTDQNDFVAIEEYTKKFKFIEEDYMSIFKDKVPGHGSNFSPSELFKLENSADRLVEAADLHVQLRRFLAMAFSTLQLKTDMHDMSTWHWVEWLSENNDKIKLAVSFNYDLNLERALSCANIPYHRIGSSEVAKGIPVLKPHGSIDFDLPKAMTKFMANAWAINATLTDAQFVDIVPRENWLNPRVEADIIVPSLHNIQSNLSWVRRMFKTYENAAKEIDNFVIIGCSYWDVDRPEIDFFLSELAKGTKVHVIDLNPSPELKAKIIELDLFYSEVLPTQSI
jgi:hypothetical protein